MLLTLIVHNSDRIVHVFHADSEEDLLEELKHSDFWEDIFNRVECDFNNRITINNINAIQHDGDSVNGYTLWT